MTARRWTVRMSVLLVLAALVAGAVAVAPAASSATSSPSSARGRLSVGVEVLRFTASGRRTKATGVVSARLTDNRGHVQNVRTTVALVAAAGGGNCQVLHLYLNQLNLVLLGLTAHLDKVQLDITGNAHGGVLGSLFCKLAKAKVASARASAARRLTTAVRQGGGHALRFSAQISPVKAQSAAAGATCPVLDLIVGPLNLQLLGLVVNLNQVHLKITAQRGAGTLGDTFCQLADNSTTTTTTTTTHT